MAVRQAASSAKPCDFSVSATYFKSVSPSGSGGIPSLVPAQGHFLQSDEPLVEPEPEQRERDDAGVHLGNEKRALRAQDIEADAAVARHHLGDDGDDERDREADAHA